MKTISFIIIMLFSGIALQAETTINYEYDSAGNRIMRHVVTIGQTPVLPRHVAKPLGEDDNGQQKIVIYPNPTQGAFSVEITGLRADKQNFYLLYTLSGKIMKKNNITVPLTSVNISGAAPGIYLLDISLDGNISHWKIVKQ